MQFGPITRQPAARALVTIARSRSRPSSPHSPNPAEMMQMAGTAFSMQSSTTASTCADGTATITRSMAIGTAVTRG